MSSGRAATRGWLDASEISAPTDEMAPRSKFPATRVHEKIERVRSGEHPIARDAGPFDLETGGARSLGQRPDWYDVSVSQVIVKIHGVRAG